MRIRFTKHALSRMKEYDIPESEVLAAIAQPDKVVQGHRDRKIAQKAVNGHVIRIVYEEAEDLIVVVTVYRARRERYE
jgi:hypothetical protein